MMDEIRKGLWNEYLDIDFGLSCVGMCKVCGAPIMENERMLCTETGLRCENCIGLQEDND